VSIKYDKILNLGDNFLNLVEFSDNIDPSTSYFLKNSVEHLTYSEKHDQKLLKDNRIEYRLNNYSHRSEDFNPIDNTKKNILFAGCSSTFGIGLPENYIWTKNIYNEIKLENKGSFQSLTFPGGGADRVVSNIFKYCKKFGNPDYIFISFADYTREIIFKEEDLRFYNHINVNYKTMSLDLSTESAVNMFLRFQMLYRMLETYCHSNNIMLFSTSWDSVTVEPMSKIFSNSFFKNEENINDYVDNFNIDSIKKEDHDLLGIARDGHHQGIIMQKMMSDMLLKRFYELTTKNS
jgi:hypothetical protein